jgi:hypothetical protein
MNPKAPALIAVFAAISSLPASSRVVFSESFEAPVVTGFDDNTVPSGGKWIGTDQGFGSSNRGLYNHAVVWPATPPFTTPYGDQAYYLSYTNSALTTAEGATGQTLTADVVYQVAFNTAVAAGTTSGNYRVELVAFAPGEVRNDARGTFGTVLATATGAVSTRDMSAAGSLTFTAGAGNAHLGKDLGIRLVKSTHSVLYDNIRLITGHDLNPSPASGEDFAVGGNVTLRWTNLPPNAPAAETPVDVWFGTHPGSLGQVTDGLAVSSALVNAAAAGTYFWRVDSYPDGDPDGTPVTGDVFSFTIADTDGDGMPDEFELANTDLPSATSLDPAADDDSDGLGNLEEFVRGTGPNEDDTDGDGLLDGVESATGTWASASNTGTLPLVADSDGDGLADGVETRTGVWVGSTNTGTDPHAFDSDGDGLSDGAETRTGDFVSAADAGTDPHDKDTDGDGAWDWYEIAAAFTDPHDDGDFPSSPYPLPDPNPSDTGSSNKPVKVYILSGQSNMLGYGTVDGTGGNTLRILTKVQNRFPNLIDDGGAWTVRKDVSYRGVISGVASGPLAPGMGKDSNSIGPELGFGHIVGWHHDEPVLLIKSCIGNRSLGWDILPPGSPSFADDGHQYAAYGDRTLKWLIGETPVPGNWYAGKEFDRFFMDESEWAHPDTAETNVVDLLDNFASLYPGWASQGFEIAGFAWWQGDKDRYDPGHATRYERNLVHLIHSLRGYYTNRYPGKVANNAPFVLATLGQTVLDDSSNPAEKAILDAMLAVDGDSGKYPQFAGNVRTVYAHPLSQGGSSNAHYNSHALTYLLVGDALGRAMLELHEAASGPDESPPVAINLSPANGSTGISAGANLVATFNEPIGLGSGTITLRDLPDDGPADDVVIAVTDASQVSVSGNTLTIHPTLNLATSTQFAVLVDAGAIEDLAGNGYAGISDPATWNFSTADPDAIAPTLFSTTPANGATVVADSNLQATFSEPIAPGSGSVTLMNLTDGPTEDLVIDITDSSQVAVSGAVLTLNPAADLPLGKSFAVRIAATAIEDLVGNRFAGIGDAATWTFSTPAPPPLNVVFFDDFEAGSNPGALPATSGAYSNTPNVASYTVANTSGQANSALWVRATSGFASTRNGLVDDSENGGASFNDPAGSQAWAGRYSSNTGITTAEGVIGALVTGQTITVSFDAVIDGSNNGSAIHAMLVAFNPGAARNAVEFPGKDTAAVLKLLTGVATNSYQNHSFSYTVGDDVQDNNGGASGGGVAWLESLSGKDLAIRFAHRNGSIVDNVRVTITGGAEVPPFAAWTADAWSGTLADVGADLDFDGGGLATGIEWVLGGDPTDPSDDAGLAPTIDRSHPDGRVRFTFRRTTAALNDSNTALAVQYGSDLAGWINAVHQGSGPDQIAITEASGALGIDLVTVALPPGLAAGGRLFVRLNVTVAHP